MSQSWYLQNRKAPKTSIIHPLPCRHNLYLLWIATLSSLKRYLKFPCMHLFTQQISSRAKIARRNINNFRYSDDTTLTAESEKELKSLLMKVKEESENPSLKLNKMKIMASGPITSWQIDGETMEKVTDFIFLAPKITVDSDCSHEIKIRLLLELVPNRKRSTLRLYIFNLLI